MWGHWLVRLPARSEVQRAGAENKSVLGVGRLIRLAALGIFQITLFLQDLLLLRASGVLQFTLFLNDGVLPFLGGIADFAGLLGNTLLGVLFGFALSLVVRRVYLTELAVLGDSARRFN